MKFKVGDKVKVVKNSLNTNQYLGKVGTIEKVEKDDTNQLHCIVCIDDEYLWFSEDELELVNKNDDVITNYKNKDIKYEMGKYESLGKEIGKLVDLKQKAYGNSVKKTYEIFQILLQDYDNGDGTYTIPKSLLLHILLTARDLDKTNRLFSNPDGDLMEESPYADKTGYGLLGMAMVHEL